jgi:hypothetical protein
MNVIDKEKICDYLVDEYNLERVPCAIPKNDFEHFKRDLYFAINDLFDDKYNRKKKIFWKLNKFSPIKFSEERPDGEEYFYLRDINKKIILELRLDTKRQITTTKFRNQKFQKPTDVFIGYTLTNLNTNLEYVIDPNHTKKEFNSKNIFDIIDNVFYLIKELKPFVREKQLEKLIS